MNDLKESREFFIRATGRYDLLESGDLTANVDKGANKFINAAQRYLDRRIDHPQLFRNRFFNVALNDFFVTIPDILQVDVFIVIDPDGTKTVITNNFFRLEEFWIRNPDNPANWTTGLPNEWALNIIGLAPDQQDATSVSFTADSIADAEHVEFGKAFSNIGILFVPKADKTYTFNIIGKFRSPVLAVDTDTSFWTSNPELLGLAGAYILETFFRDRAGVAARLEALEPYLDSIDSEAIGFEIEPLGTRIGGR